MLRLISAGFNFNKSCFTGGVSKLDVDRMREEAKTEGHCRKTVKSKQSGTATGMDSFDSDLISLLVTDKVREEVSRIERKFNTMCESNMCFQTSVLRKLEEITRSLQSVADSRSSARVVDVEEPSPEVVNVKKTSKTNGEVDKERDRPSIIDEVIQFVSQSIAEDSSVSLHVCGYV